MKLSRKTSIKLAVASGLCLLCVCAFRATVIGHRLWPPRRVATASDVPVFNTPSDVGRDGLDLDLRVRTIHEEPVSILITRESDSVDVPDVPDHWPVFLYEGEGRHLSSVDPARWWDAGGETTWHGGVGGGAVGFARKEVDGVMQYHVGPTQYRDFETVGEFAAKVTLSHDGAVVCVLTADGPKRPRSSIRDPWFGGTFGGGFYGQHYVECFRLPGMTPTGDAVRIPFTTVDGIDMPCWSADGRFLVYANRNGTQTCVIHVEKEGREP